MATSSPSLAPVELIKEGDFVFINGGGGQRIAEVKKDVKLRLGRSGTAAMDSLVGMRFGEVVRLDHAAKKFVTCDAYPDLDVSDVQEANDQDLQARDNRNLNDDNLNQLLTPEEINAIRSEKGVDALLTELAEKSKTFHTKTEFAKEKYLKKKQKKYGTLFKVERVTPDNLAELHVPCINPSDSQPEEAKSLRLRADTVALILHHADVHDGSRVLSYDRTNGLLAAYLLSRLGQEGKLFQVLDKSAQPNMFPARQMGLERIKERWSCIPRHSGFLVGACKSAPEELKCPSHSDKENGEGRRNRNQEGPSSWMKGLEARELLLREPVDSLVIADDEQPARPLGELLPFLAYGGHLVIYSPFLEDLTDLFPQLRADCVNIRISETWYRYQQVLPQRTHPTVNMSTAAGYLLTAVKVERQPNRRSHLVVNPTSTATVVEQPSTGVKHAREEDAEDVSVTAVVPISEAPVAKEERRE